MAWEAVVTDEIYPEDDAVDTLPDPVEEDLDIDAPGVPDPEDDLLEREDTEYTDPDG